MLDRKVARARIPSGEAPAEEARLQQDGLLVPRRRRGHGVTGRRRVWGAAIPILAALLGLCRFGSESRAETSWPDTSKAYTSNELVRMALDRNLDLAQALQSIANARGATLRARSVLLPNISESSINYSQGTTQTPIHSQIISGVVVTIPSRTVTDQYSLRLALSQDLLDPPSYFSLRQAQEELSSAGSGYADARRTLSLSVEQEYYTIVQDVDLASVARDAYTLSLEQLHRSQALFELGSVAKADVIQAQVNVASADRDRIAAINTIDEERARLNLLLALPIDVPLKTAVPDSLPDSLQTPPMDDLIRQAESQRPDYQKAQSDFRAAQMAEKSVRWSRYPTLAGGLSYSNQRLGPVSSGDGNPVDVFKNLKGDGSWGFDIGLNVPIFDGFRTKGGIVQAQASRVQSQEAVDKSRLQIALDLREAVLAIRNASEQIRSAREGVHLAEENVRLQKALYESGGGTLLDWNNALVDLTRARVAFVQAQATLHVAKAGLDSALGEGPR